MKNLHPDLQRSYEQRLLTNTRSFEEILADRQLSHYSEHGLAFDDIAIDDLHINGVRVIRIAPLEAQESAPAVVWMHGGGMVFGQPDDAITYLRNYALELGATVFAPQYRLAPEHPYPAALEDGYKVLQWVAANAAALNVDREQIIVGGASAGGNLALAIALYARDHGGPAIAGVISSYPMLEPNVTAFHEQFTSPAYWSLAKNTKAWAAYLRGHDALPKYASPLYADVSGLPPIYTFIGSLDMFYDEVLAFIDKVKAAGGAITYDLDDGCPHSFDMEEAPIAELARARTLQAAAQFLQR